MIYLLIEAIENTSKTQFQAFQLVWDDLVIDFNFSQPVVEIFVDPEAESFHCFPVLSVYSDLPYFLLHFELIVK